MMNPIDQYSELLDQTWATQARDFFDRLYTAWSETPADELDRHPVDLERADFEAFRDLAKYARDLQKERAELAEMIHGIAGVLGVPCSPSCAHNVNGSADGCDVARIIAENTLEVLVGDDETIVRVPHFHRPLPPATEIPFPHEPKEQPDGDNE